MKEIEKYIKHLCKDVSLEPKELKEFKAEIRNHLLDTVHELKQQGNSEKKSIELALKRFGEERHINLELRRVFTFQRTFKKTIFLSSIFALALSLLLQICYIVLEKRNVSDFDGMQLYYHTHIESKIQAGQSITSEEIEQFYNTYERILRHIYILKTENNFRTAEYLYPSGTSSEDLKMQPIMTYPIAIKTENSETSWEVQFALKRSTLFSPIPNAVLIISIILFAFYWILFGLWSTVNAYRTNRLNLIWAVLFFSLNLFAYIIFKLVYRIKLRKLRIV